MLKNQRFYIANNDIFRQIRGNIMKEKDFYRKQIIEMVEKINRCDILNYIYTLISKIAEREGNNA